MLFSVNCSMSCSPRAVVQLDCSKRQSIIFNIHATHYQRYISYQIGLIRAETSAILIVIQGVGQSNPYLPLSVTYAAIGQFPRM